MIETSVESIGNVFSSDILPDGEELGLFEIPPIQREYQWGIGHRSNEKINRSAKELIDDLINFHKFNSDNDLPYFTGTIIVYKEDDAEPGHFQLMDGQQRWTTYTALMSTIYYWLDQSATQDWQEIKDDISRRFLVSEENDWRLASYRNWDDMLIYNLSTITGDFEIEEWDHTQYDAPTSTYRPYEKTYKGTNLQCVAMFFKDLLSETFNVEGPLSDMTNLVNFYLCIRDRVHVNLTVAPSSSVAYEMFITANARGTPLNNFDIFRGLIITRERELELNIAQQVRQLLQNCSGQLTEFTNFRHKKDRDDEINILMAQICSILSGQRVEKATVMFYLKEQIRNLNTADDIIEYCTFVFRYVRVRVFMDNRRIFCGEDSYNRLAYIGFTSHISIFTTAYSQVLQNHNLLPAMDKLIKGIECFVMRILLAREPRPASLYFYENAPHMAYRIHSEGLSMELVNEMLLDFEEDEKNPESLAPLGNKYFSVPNSYKISFLISAFYALENLENGPYSSGEGSRDVRMISHLKPPFTPFTEEANTWDYGDEAIGQSYKSYTIGNLFLLRPPATEIRAGLGDTNVDVAGRLAMFRNRSPGMLLSADQFLNVANWNSNHILNRTNRLVERFERRFPRNCSL